METERGVRQKPVKGNILNRNIDEARHASQRNVRKAVIYYDCCSAFGIACIKDADDVTMTSRCDEREFLQRFCKWSTDGGRNFSFIRSSSCEMI